MARGERGICPRPGTIVETSLGARFQFTRPDGARCWFRTADGGEDSRYAHLLGGDSTWIKQGGTSLKDLFPLQPGKSRWFVVSGVTTTSYPASWYQTYTVGSRERIQTRAGTFDAYPIDWEEQGREGNAWQVRHRFWFAPEVGYFVKFVADPRTELQDWEAIRVVVPKSLHDTSVAEADGAHSGSSTPSHTAAPRRRR
jgi:hypothetical protein